MTELNSEFDLNLGMEEPTPVLSAVAGEIDPEDDRANWPTINIDHEPGKPNYEYVAVHGTKKDGSSFGHELQIMRGVDVQVPPSVVYMLRTSTRTDYTPQRDPATGRLVMIPSDRPPLPWRLVKGGKYC